MTEESAAWQPTGLGETIFKDRYARDPEESWEQACKRVADHVAQAESNGAVRNYSDRFYDQLASNKFNPGGRIWYGAGRPKAQLLNCLKSSTLVHTAEGLIRAGDLAGKTTDVLSDDGVFRSSEWYNFGEQELYEITFENGDKIETTAEHNWWIPTGGRNRYNKVATKDLVGSNVPLQGISNFEYDEDDWYWGVRHGLIFGDGNLYLDGRFSCLNQFGDSLHLVSDFWDESEIVRYNDWHWHVNKQPNTYKSLPDMDKSRSYIRGFIAGLLATDDHVSGASGTVLHNKDESVLEQIRTLAAYAGMPTVSVRLSRKTSPFDGSDKPLFKLSFTKSAFWNDGVLDRKLVLKNSHLKNALDGVQPRNRGSVRVVDVQPTGIVEDVFCCVEPETHSFVIETGYLTGNCFVVPTHDSREGWGKTTSDVIVISGLMGGVGINVSPIRPRGYDIKGTGGVATGAVSLMQLINGVGDVIVGGGGRRMALMLCLDLDHPDLEEFLKVKLDLNQLNNANISIVIPDDMPTDQFVRAVREDGDIALSFNGVPSGKSIKAKWLWEKMVENAWQSGEPGILNSYLANKMNNIWYHKPLISTNPCFAASEYLLTESGYRTFGDLYDEGIENTVLADNRVTYADDGGPESIEKWIVDTKADQGVSSYPASPVGLTRKMTQIVKVNTNAGLSVRCTPDHKIGTINGMVEAQDLENGVELLVSIPEPTGSVRDRMPESTAEKAAFLMGLITGDGTFGVESSGTHTANIDLWGEDSGRMADICASIIDSLYTELYADGMPEMTPHNAWNTRKLAPYHKTIKDDKVRIRSAWLANFLAKYGFTRETKHIVPEMVMRLARTDVGRFYLAGLFYVDGTVNDHPNAYSVRISQSNEATLKQVQLLLHANGMLSNLYLRRDAHEKQLPDDKGGHKAQFELIVSHYRSRFAQTIGFAGHLEKEAKVDRLPESKSRQAIKVVSVESDGTEDVFCLQQKETRTIVVGGITATRCGEIWLEEYGCCDLGALVLPRFVDNGKMDWDALDESVRLGVRFLDNVLTVNHYPLPEIQENCENTRRIGLGVMGLHTMLLNMGMKYDSEEAFEFIDRLFDFIKNVSYDASVNLAIEKGPFTVYDPRFLDSGFVKTLDYMLRNKIREHGIRNCAILTIPPTGTTSMVSNVSSGIEPLPPAVYWRNYYKPTKDGTRELTKELVVEEAYYQYPDLIQSAIDVSIESHFKMQKIVQRHIDNAVSKTINMAADFPKDAFGDIWLEYLPYLKGTTVYRYGSRENEPIQVIPREQWDGLVSEHISQQVEGMTEAEYMALDCPTGVCEIPTSNEATIVTAIHSEEKDHNLAS